MEASGSSRKRPKGGGRSGNHLGGGGQGPGGIPDIRREETPVKGTWVDREQSGLETEVWVTLVQAW